MPQNPADYWRSLTMPGFGPGGYWEALMESFAGSPAGRLGYRSPSELSRMPQDTARTIYDMFLSKPGELAEAASPIPIQQPQAPQPAGISFGSGASNVQKRSQFATQAVAGNTGLYRTPEAQQYYKSIIRSLASPTDQLLPVERQFGQEVFGLNPQGLNMQSYLDALAPLFKKPKPKPRTPLPFIPSFNMLFTEGGPNMAEGSRDLEEYSDE